MTYEVRLARKAAMYISRLDRATADPFGPRTKPLTNAAGKRSSRVGDCRLVYSVDLDTVIIDISTVAPRGRAYRDV